MGLWLWLEWFDLVGWCYCYIYCLGWCGMLQEFNLEFVWRINVFHCIKLILNHLKNITKNKWKTYIKAIVFNFMKWNLDNLKKAIVYLNDFNDSHNLFFKFKKYLKKNTFFCGMVCYNHSSWCIRSFYIQLKCMNEIKQNKKESIDNFKHTHISSMFTTKLLRKHISSAAYSHLVSYI